MELRIRVGAAVDRSLSEAYKPLIKAAEQAAQAVARQSARTSQTVAREAKRGAREEERAYAAAAKEIEKWQRERVRGAERSASTTSREAKRAAEQEKRAYADASREIEKWRRERASKAEKNAAAQAKAIEKAAAAEARAVDKAEKDKSRAIERENARRNRDNLRAQRERQHAFIANARHNDRVVIGAVSRGIDAGKNIAGGVGGILAGAGRAAGSFALGAVGDIARGAGVDTDFGSMVRKNTALESKATELSNSGYIAGDKRNQRVDPRALMRDALSLGRETGTDANDALEGLIKFAGKTGDLATGREILKDLAIYSKATGSNLDDMVDAAGDVSSVLGDLPNKAELIRTTMKTIAGQGKLGAVEIKNMASQMAKLAANATQIEGDTGANIALLGAFAQEARQRGGASSATMAATSVASLINTFKTPARVGEFEAATGKKVFNKSGMLRNPEELVIEALRAKGMDPTGFKKIFANVQGARAVEGFATLYRQAGGGEAGEAAVRAEFDRLKKAVMADAEIMESFRRSMATSEAQANVFNNSMREAAQSITDTLKPSLMELAPIFVSMAKTGAQVVDWLVGTDARTRQLQAETTGKVGSSVEETKKQLGQGFVFQQQLDVNKQTEKDAFYAAAKAKADAETFNPRDKMSGVTKAVLRISDYVDPSAWVGQAITGSKRGESMINRSESVIAEREQRAKDAQRNLEEIRGTNEHLANLIAQKVIEVRIVEDKTVKPGAPPGVSGEGRSPSPEEKTRK